jgi:hypothetical protein
MGLIDANGMYEPIALQQMLTNICIDLPNICELNAPKVFYSHSGGYSLIFTCGDPSSVPGDLSELRGERCDVGAGLLRVHQFSPPTAPRSVR